jgi:hypothetical protein
MNILSRPEATPGAQHVSHLSSTMHHKLTMLELPIKLRLRVYEYVFQRTPSEGFVSLHLGKHASSNFGVLLTCHQIYEEALPIYRASTITSLWPQCQHDAASLSYIALKKSTVYQSWKVSPHGLRVQHNSSSIRHLAMLTTLTREVKAVCNHFFSSASIQSNKLRITDLYIRLCICGALRWLHEAPQNLQSFCLALEELAARLPSLQRVHIMYCGQQWPVWIQALGDVRLPELIVSHHQSMLDSSWTVRQYLHQSDSVGNHGHSSLSFNMTSKVGASNLETLPFERRRSVTVNYYDSWTILRERCVRNKPAQETGQFP